ncbi:hypothetical protein PSTT_13229, partial [Puccinia striiformis]
PNKLLKLRAITTTGIAASLLSLVSVECLPAKNSVIAPGTSGTDLTHSKNGLMQTMGQVQESNCAGNTMSWSKNKTPWEKLQLASNLNLYQNVWQGAISTNKVLDSGMSDITCRLVEMDNQVPHALQSQRQQPGQDLHQCSLGWNSGPIKNAKIFNVTWEWKLTEESPDLVADVSFDIFLTKDPNCRKQECASREVMMWLGAIGGAKPAGQPASPGTVKIGGKYDFQVWQGKVNVPVVSIFPSDVTRRYTSFKADLKRALHKLTQYGVGEDEYIMSVGAGIEVFKGSGTLRTSNYIIDLY